MDAGGFELPLAYGLVVFVLAAAGGGDLSLDAALGLDIQGLAWAAAAAGVAVAGALASLTVSRLTSTPGEPAPAASA